MFNRKVSEMRKADKLQPCVEMHCKGNGVEHNYGSPECSWVLRMGSVVPKSDFGKRRGQAG